MLDIALIREQPDWVKEQLRKLSDEAALARIDAILELDRTRRALLTEVEAIKANRNQLNKQMGAFRANKQLTSGQIVGASRAAIQALNAGNIQAALEALTVPQAIAGPVGESPDATKTALDDLTRT
ncbi:MAG TPA: hypothetical protein VMT24_17215, partial [Aggregatilineaceae bacterium]|nr:hypothetical protein [Aggregatilineaceae bacterium]